MVEPPKTIGAESQEALVIIVDDDQDIRDALADLLRSVGIASIGFSSTSELMSGQFPERPGCMVLDVRLPGTSGLNFQAQLNAGGYHLPIIFLSGHGDIAMTVRAMKAGAHDFLTKPIRDQDMLDAVFSAIDRDRTRRSNESEISEVVELAATLTRREREVASAVSRGLMNKQIAHELGISEITVKLHRGSVMRKMEARSIVELARKIELVSHASAPA